MDKHKVKLDHGPMDGQTVEVPDAPEKGKRFTVRWHDPKPTYGLSPSGDPGTWHLTYVHNGEGSASYESKSRG